jgi:hypothetical protein
MVIYDFMEKTNTWDHLKCDILPERGKKRVERAGKMGSGGK